MNVQDNTERRNKKGRVNRGGEGGGRVAQSAFSERKVSSINDDATH